MTERMRPPNSFLWLMVMLLLTLLAIHLRAQDDADVTHVTKQAYFVCDGKCLTGAAVTPHTQLIAPYVDGKPDFSKAVVKSVSITYKKELARIEMK